MSNMEQVIDNIKTFESTEPLSDSEFKDILNIAKEMTKNIPCTSCRYCTEYCPQGLDIPKHISLYNELKFTGGGF
jgi:predicted aldo/keto reductase-like oxidoreductase